MTSYDSNYRKIASIAELSPDKPQVFRAAGATLVVRRYGAEVTAIDGSCLAEEADLSEEQRVRRIMACVAAGTGSSSVEWDDLHARAGLAVRIEEGDIWVCVEDCRP